MVWVSIKQRPWVKASIAQLAVTWRSQCVVRYAEVGIMLGRAAKRCGIKDGFLTAKQERWLRVDAGEMGTLG